MKFLIFFVVIKLNSTLHNHIFTFNLYVSSANELLQCCLHFICSLWLEEPGQLNCIALCYRLDDWGLEYPQGLRIFLFTTESIPAVGPTQPPIQWVPETLCLGVNGRGVKLTTHHHLVLRSECVELYLHSPILPMAWCSLKKRTGTFIYDLNICNSI
jgi:hypothetical protein